ncbi:MAG TPA: hypothetical protein PLL83_00115 [Rhodoferax sp.]|nr:glycine zipper domain-containing protein [Rhodoferax sp.]HOF52583.1 hypothetical protein [Rhodoferax sp.]HPW82752.1 hypothetical protein [Rhodoferax sp.]HQY75567.1 hypothetical protein [Rhodoferax sp.]
MLKLSTRSSASRKGLSALAASGIVVLAALTAPAHANDIGTLLGGGVGAAAGAVLGQSVGGRQGAVIGGAIGGATGAAVSTHGRGHNGAVIGAAVGGAAGAAVGQSAGGRNGAVLGAGAGGAAGAAIGRGVVSQPHHPQPVYQASGPVVHHYPVAYGPVYQPVYQRPPVHGYGPGWDRHDGRRDRWERQQRHHSHGRGHGWGHDGRGH